ncbi:hypothetical protein M0802_004572 [Mischocyttarus mexicanus]|nr:hypothetical protein M0802_004572 [Mischocyttarus mexicanus]
MGKLVPITRVHRKERVRVVQSKILGRATEKGDRVTTIPVNEATVITAVFTIDKEKSKDQKVEVNVESLGNTPYYRKHGFKPMHSGYALVTK